MVSDVQALADELQKTWHDFKASNDDRLKGIENRFDDVVQNEKVDRINAEITRIKDLMNEQTKALGRLTVGGSGGGDDEKVRAHAKRFFAAKRGRDLKPGEPEPDIDLGAYNAYKPVFWQMIANGGPPNAHLLPSNIQAALTVGSDTGGGYLVPDETSTEMARRVFDTSPMRQIANVITINAPAWEAPYKSADATSGGWVGERQARTATATPTVGMQRIEVHEQYAMPEVTQNMLDDGAIDVGGFIVSETQDKMGRTENTAFVTGTGFMQPKGFVAASYTSGAATTADASRAWGTLQYRATGAAGEFATVSGQTSQDLDPLITVVTDLNPAYRQGAVWTMNRQTEALVRKSKDRNDRYFIDMGSIEGGLAFTLLGYGIVNLEDMADVAANSFSMAFGNFRAGYYIVDRQGFRVLTDPYSNKPYVGFYITRRTGGDVRNFDAIKLVKFGTS